MNVLVRDCGPRFFSLPLPGCLLLTLNFIKAAGSIISAVDYKEVRFPVMLCVKFSQMSEGEGFSSFHSSIVHHLFSNQFFFPLVYFQILLIIIIKYYVLKPSVQKMTSTRAIACKLLDDFL